MKLIGRVLWFLLQLIYRLIVLVMFERWIPFPDKTPEPPAQKPREKQAKQKKQKQQRKPPPIFRPDAAAAAREKRARAARFTEPAFFEATSSELSPELAARREGEHWLPRAPRAPGQRRARSGERETLASVLRDPRALRSAVVLGAALGTRRSKL